MFAARNVFLTNSSESGPVITGGQQEFTTAGTYIWQVPSGVSSICVVCVGGGGGGMYYGVSNSSFTYAMNGGAGGGLVWVNGISVSPGQRYDIVVGAGGSGGAYPSGSTDGGASSFKRRGSSYPIICEAGGGSAGTYTTSTISGGTFNVASGYGTSNGGGRGGPVTSLSLSSYGPAGGGGAGGYEDYDDPIYSPPLFPSGGQGSLTTLHLVALGRMVAAVAVAHPQMQLM